MSGAASSRVDGGQKSFRPPLAVWRFRDGWTHDLKSLNVALKVPNLWAVLRG